MASPSSPAIIEGWDDTLKVVVGQDQQMIIPGLETLKAYGSLDEPLYNISDISKFLDIEPKKVKSYINDFDIDIEYKIVDGRHYLTTNGIIALSFKESSSDVARFIKRVIYNCIKELRIRHQELLRSIVERTKAENQELYERILRQQQEALELQRLSESLIVKVNEADEHREEAEMIAEQTRKEVRALQQKDRAAVLDYTASLMESVHQELKDPERIFMDLMIKKHSKMMWIYDNGNGRIHITDRENGGRIALTQIPMVDNQEYREVLNYFEDQKDSGGYSIGIEDLRQFINELRMGEPDLQLQTQTNTYASFLNGEDAQALIDRHIR